MEDFRGTSIAGGLGYPAAEMSGAAYLTRRGTTRLTPRHK
jgi:hypothetical protein